MDIYQKKSLVKEHSDDPVQRYDSCCMLKASSLQPGACRPRAGAKWLTGTTIIWIG